MLGGFLVPAREREPLAALAHVGRDGNRLGAVAQPPVENLHGKRILHLFLNEAL